VFVCVGACVGGCLCLLLLGVEGERTDWSVAAAGWSCGLWAVFFSSYICKKIGKSLLVSSLTC
jgi:hypothetical protein